MNITVLGTGTVGRAHAEKLLSLGYDVTVGTRSVKKAISLNNNRQFSEWYQEHKAVNVKTFNESVGNSEVVFNALRGDVSIDVLLTLRDQLAGKILVDISNPLDFSNGMPPTLSISNTDSLGESIQKALPETLVVKAFNTLNSDLQINPRNLCGGDHDLLICGNNSIARERVKLIAKEYGWLRIIDLGDISSSRGMEMFLPLWLRLWSSLSTAAFNLKIVQ